MRFGIIGAAMRNKDDWNQEEAGWYTKIGVGGIVQEDDGYWYFYPVSGDDRHGPYTSLKGAMITAKGIASDSHRD